MSGFDTHKRYVLKFIGRLILLAGAIVLYLKDRNSISLLFTDFFGRFSFAHLLWLGALYGMVLQTIPLPFMPTGCMKQFRFRYAPAAGVPEGFGVRYLPQNEEEAKLLEQLKAYRKDELLRGLVTLVVWFALNSAWPVLRHFGLIGPEECFVGTFFFMVFDLICILFFCPFRVCFQRTRCCSTCSIFNYGQLFLCTPLIGLSGFGPVFLTAVGLGIFVKWNLSFFLHPERFWDRTNRNLRCNCCNDRLCRSRSYIERKVIRLFPKPPFEEWRFPQKNSVRSSRPKPPFKE